MCPARPVRKAVEHTLVLSFTSQTQLWANARMLSQVHASIRAYLGQAQIRAKVTPMARPWRAQAVAKTEVCRPPGAQGEAENPYRPLPPVPGRKPLQHRTASPERGPLRCSTGSAPTRQQKQRSSVLPVFSPARKLPLTVPSMSGRSHPNRLRSIKNNLPARQSAIILSVPAPPRRVGPTRGDFALPLFV